MIFWYPQAKFIIDCHLHYYYYVPSTLENIFIKITLNTFKFQSVEFIIHYPNSYFGPVVQTVWFHQTKYCVPSTGQNWLIMNTLKALWGQSVESIILMHILLIFCKYQKVNGFDLGTHIPWTNEVSWVEKCWSHSLAFSKNIILVQRTCAWLGRTVLPYQIFIPECQMDNNAKGMCSETSCCESDSLLSYFPHHWISLSLKRVNKLFCK